MVGERRSSLSNLRTAPPTIERNRGSYRRPDGSEDWYLNGPLGLEHGFVVPEYPAGEGKLVIEVTVEGDLEPVLVGGGSYVSLRNAEDVGMLRYSDLSATDADGKALAARLDVIGGAILMVIDDEGARYPLRVDPLLWIEVKRLTASDAPGGFGISVAVDADTAIVGRIGYPVSAYVFERNLGGVDNWGERIKITASGGGSTGVSFCAVALSGDTAIIADAYESGGGSLRGGAYIFERNVGGPNNWGERLRIVPNDPQDNAGFGWSVALSGDTAIVGATGQDVGGVPAGVAYVFERDHGGTNVWGQRTAITADVPHDSDGFGVAVALSGDTAIVGARGVDGAGLDRGAAYVFERDLGGADSWGQRVVITASDAQDEDHFGNSVSISNDTALVGAHDEDGSGANRGAAYVFERNLTGVNAWGERAKLSASDTSDQQRFGGAVSVSNDTAIIGANANAYIFDRDYGGMDAWGERAKRAVQSYGYSQNVSLAGNTALIGSAEGPGGAAYIFQWAQVGQGCSSVSECVGGLCVDGVCCDSACGGGATDDCYACSTAAGASTDGVCEALTGTNCSDGAFCNGADTCQSGSCTQHAGNPCPGADGDADCAESCDEASDDCLGADPESASCDDGLFCTATDTCQSGVCTGTGDPCDGNPGDGDDDCAESCNEDSDDCTANDSDGDSCDDGLFCTENDSCQAGVCTGPNPCPGADGDGNCNESCDEDNDNCQGPDPDGAACADDGIYCNGPNTCQGGSCLGSGNPCPGPNGDSNCAESCDEENDSCTAPDTNGSPCNDGVACTTPDTCSGGICTPGPSTCGLFGEPCSTADDCTEGTCVDGVCCSVPSCAPYRCGPTGDCRETCTSTADCQPGFACSSDGKCVDASAASDASDDGGCSCTTPGRRPAPPALPLMMLGLAGALARRRRWNRAA